MGAKGIDILKETIIFATAIVVGVGAWIAIEKINAGKRMEAEHRKQQTMLEDELRQKEREEDRRRDEEKARAQQIAEDARRERERQAKLERELQLKAETEKSERMEMLRKRYEDITRALDRCKIEYWRDAPEEEKKARKISPCVYFCIVARQIDDEVSVVEMKFDPSTNAIYSIVTSDAEPKEIVKDEFDELVKGRPYFVVREEANRPADVLYLSMPKNKSGETYPMIKSSEDFNPSRIELGVLYDRLGDKGASRAPNFSYVVFLHANGQKEGMPICEVNFGEAVSYETIRIAIENELMKQRLRAKLLSLSKRKKADAPKKPQGFVNHSTMSKKSLHGEYTPGEFHGTTTSYVGPGWLWRSSSSRWSDSHYIRRGSSYSPKVYTHWRELANMREQIKRENEAMSSAYQLRQDYRPIVIDAKEVDGIVKKATISFKVVE